jgi:hypothetical protein
MVRNETERHAAAPIERPDQKVNSLVAEFLEEKKRAADAEKPKRRGPLNKHVVTALLALVCVAAWIAPYPTGESTKPVDPKVERASARVSLFLTAQSVVHFRVNQGRLPRTLSEAGVSGSSVRYYPGRDGSFVLQASVRDHTLTYDSNLPAHSILGNAEQVIMETGH